MDEHENSRLHRRARERRANWLVYGPVRVSFQIFFLVYFRMRRIGREHIPKHGPVIIASNHRSFLDPFVIACMARRPMYYVAKKEIFRYNRVLAWLLSALGAFPVDRGAGDAQFIETAQTILARGDIVLIFPEGTRTRPGPLGRPKRGVGRLALQSGVPVVPLALIGTEAIRRGWRIRPHRVTVRAGRALRFPHVAEPSVALGGAVTDRIWPCVMLQWEWLGGQPPARRAAIVGDGAWSAGLHGCLTRAGIEVSWVPASAGPSLADCDLVCLAVPTHELPHAMADHGAAIPSAAGVLVLDDGAAPPLATVPSAYVAERCAARAVAAIGVDPADERPLAPGASVMVASVDRGFARELTDVLRSGGLEARRAADVTTVAGTRGDEDARRLATRSG